MSSRSTTKQELLDKLVQEIDQHLSIIRQRLREPLETEFARGGLTGPQRMVIVVEQPRQTPDQIQLTQADGDPIALVRRGANATLARISPYRVAEAHYTQGLENNDP